MKSKLKRCMKVVNYSERLWKLHAVWLVVKNYYVYLGQNIYPGLIKTFSRIIVFHFVHFFEDMRNKTEDVYSHRELVGNQHGMSFWLLIKFLLWCTCQEKIAFNTFSRNWNDKTWIKRLLFLYLIPFLRNLNVIFENVLIN